MNFNFHTPLRAYGVAAGAGGYGRGEGASLPTSGQPALTPGLQVTISRGYVAFRMDETNII